MGITKKYINTILWERVVLNIKTVIIKFQAIAVKKFAKKCHICYNK